LQSTLGTNLGTKEGRSATEGTRPTTQASVFARSGSRRRLLVICIMVLSDFLVGLMMWQVASVVQGVLGRWQVSGLATASIVPNIMTWIGLRGVLGLYPGYGRDEVEDLRGQTIALGATVAVIAVSLFAFQIGALSRLLLLGWALGLLLAAPIARYFTKWTMEQAGLWGKPVVVVGSRDVGRRMVDTLRKEWHLGFRPVDFFDGRSNLQDAGVATAGTPNGRALTDTIAMARWYGLDTAILAMSHKQDHLARIMPLISTSFRYVIVMPNMGGICNSSTMIARNVAGNLGVEVKYNLLFPWARRTKRLLDVLLTVVGGLLISPLLLAIFVLIRLDSPGPAFYGHRRLGADDKHFRCWKFRTMHINSEQLLDEYLQSNPNLRAEWEQNFKLREDPRVTRIGRFLRKTSLDELPQLWNVLSGEMSLVGPRPIVDAEIPKYGAVYKMYQRIRPGISGLWQVSGRSDTGYKERVELDAYYVNTWSVWLDLVILIRTVRSVVFGRGAY
jgi:Undecaprenyl-phosphate galactose phosphotransferase WbaP